MVEYDLPSDKRLLHQQYEADSYVQAAENQLHWLEDDPDILYGLIDTPDAKITVDLVI